jgi:hypothetical protein
MRADRELCLDRGQTRLVEAGSVESAWVLIGKGQEIPDAEVRRLGLVLHEGRVMQRSAAPVVEVLHMVDAAPKPMVEVAPEPIMPPESRRSRRK